MAAFLAAFFSCFSLSTAAMISIWVSGRFSRFFALPLFRIPSPKCKSCCGGGLGKKREVSFLFDV